YLRLIQIQRLLSAYIPDDTVTSDDLSAWMSKDGSWGTTIRKQSNKKRKHFTWDDLSNIQEYRSLVRSSMATKCTVGYVRKSNTHEPDTTKKKKS
ncbi:uncharacterized protein BX664DRAFT_260428, partial [Halteromyces radiatus]|uniref:uncharacterized protein n=1 Tax=Halteromyces radiatus TaxID=101107 RepID=UPI00221ECEF3